MSYVSTHNSFSPIHDQVSVLYANACVHYIYFPTLRKITQHNMLIALRQAVQVKMNNLDTQHQDIGMMHTHPHMIGGSMTTNTRNRDLMIKLHIGVMIPTHS